MSYQEALYASGLEGEQRSEKRGREEERQETIEKMRKMGMSEEQIKEIYNS